MTDTPTTAQKRSPRRNSNNKPKPKQEVLEAVKAVEETQTAEAKSIDISGFVSNLDSNVYAIANLPEEFIATLFAWVSRSSKSFRQHLAEAVEQFDIPTNSQDAFAGLSEKAKQFHEKWTVGYGHSSVAEHATAHIGIEKVSRLASSEIELSNSFLSITEYSQRYQKPKLGEWHNPFSKDSEEYEKVEKHFTFLFETFETMVDEVHKYLDKEYFTLNGIEPSKRESLANQKLAFEDARYVLPLAMYTQLGMSANGRAWRDGLAMLGTSKYKESKDLASKTKEELSKVLPSLLKYADPSAYQMQYTQEIRDTYKRVSSNGLKPLAKLLSTVPEEIAMNEILAYYLSEAEGRPFTEALNQIELYNTEEENEHVFERMIESMQFFDNPPNAFKHIRYRAEFVVSEANWHQLLRHNRMTDFTYGSPSINNGVVIPERIRRAGLTQLFADAVNKTANLYAKLQSKGFKEELDYLVLNAHRRVVTASFSLWEAYHLINLRTSEEAQWDIRETFEELHKQLLNVHPKLISMAKRR